MNPSTYDALLTPVQLGDLALKNRVVMAPMTRNRADGRGVATAMMAEYYAQRAEAGLIVAEGAWPSAVGQAYCRQPGIETAEQIAGWRRVTDAVHACGGCIVLQIMHGGRIGSCHIKPAGVETVAPSAIQAAGEVFTDAAGMRPYDPPSALSLEQVRAVIEEHRQAAIHAREAGFDGVELHCTSGYLPMQFLASGSNRREDAYGGNAAGRARFAIECIAGMAEAIGPGRVGFRVGPGNTYNDIHDDDSAASHAALMRGVAGWGLAYLHVVRAPSADLDAFALAREAYGRNLILNDGFDPNMANAAIQTGAGDAVSFGRHFIGNPDLVERIRRAWPLAPFDRRSLYTPGAAGYIDYPAFS